MHSWMFIVLQLIVSVHGDLETVTPCRDGWLAYNGSCYLFGTDTMQFTTAEQFCRQHNGHLVHVNDAMENAFLRDRMRQLKDAYWWIGITDETIEGVWKWFDTDTVAEFLDFNKGEGTIHNEDCAAFDLRVDFKWLDTTCTNPGLHPLCETPGSMSGEHVHVIG